MDGPEENIMCKDENVDDNTSDSTDGYKDKPSKVKKEKKDFWDILGTIGRLLGSAIAAWAMMFVAGVGKEIDRRTKDWDERMDVASQTTRELELFSNREAAANETRGAVFAAFGEYMLPQLEGDDQKVALLAVLHSNFSEVFDTRPVFEAFTRSIPIDNHGSRHELMRLAKRVARRQTEFIANHGGVRSEKTLTWVAGLKDIRRIQFSLDGHEIEVGIKSKPNVLSDRHTIIKADGTLELDDVADVVEISVWNMDDPNIDAEDIEPLTFELSYMDVPYIDNIWLQHHGRIHRLAFVLKGIDKVGQGYEITVEAIHFDEDFLPPAGLAARRGNKYE